MIYGILWVLMRIEVSHPDATVVERHQQAIDYTNMGQYIAADRLFNQVADISGQDGYIVFEARVMRDWARNVWLAALTLDGVCESQEARNYMEESANLLAMANTHVDWGQPQTDELGATLMFRGRLEAVYARINRHRFDAEWIRDCSLPYYLQAGSLLDNDAANQWYRYGTGVRGETTAALIGNRTLACKIGSIADRAVVCEPDIESINPSLAMMRSRIAPTLLFARQLCSYVVADSVLR